MAARLARSARPALPWAVTSLLLGALAVLVVVLRFEALPDPYPTHIGPGGRPDDFAERTHTRILVPVLSGQVGALAVIAMSLAVPPRMPRVARALAVLGCVIGGGTALLSIAQNLDEGAVPPPWGIWVFLAAVTAVAAWLIILSVRAGGAEGADGDREHWRWGVLYVNPEDPDVFVPQRVGTGVTINLGRPLGWLLLALILAPGMLVITLVARST